jgi:choline kinase
LSAGQPKTRSKLPAPLSLVNKTTLIDSQTNTINKMYNFADIVLCTGYKSKDVTSYVHQSNLKIRLVENHNHKETSSVESLRLAINASSESNLFIIHGDRYFNKYSIDRINSSKLFTFEMNCKIKDKIGILHQNYLLNNLSYGVSNVSNAWSEMFYIPINYFEEVRSLVNYSKTNIGLYELVNIINKKYKFHIVQNDKAKVKNI